MDTNILQICISVLLFDSQSRTKFVKHCQQINQSWKGREHFDIYFCVIFDY